MVVSAAGALPALSARENGSAVPVRADDKTIIHVLNRLGFGPRPGDVERVRAIGLQAYIDRQLQPERIEDPGMAPRLASFHTLTMTSREIADQYLVPSQTLRRQRRRAQAGAGAPSAPGDPAESRGMADGRQSPGMQSRSVQPPTDRDVPGRKERTPEQREAARAERTILRELVDQKVLRAAYSERQLEEVMVDFWFNHFNVFAGKGATRGYLTAYERDAIRPHVLGRFRDLLQATAESPAMLFYLDNWQSSTPHAAALPARRSTRDLTRGDAGPSGARRKPPARASQAVPRPGAEAGGLARRPRGINENYARELMELHTIGVDGGYTQKDVQDVARAFTGWTIRNPRSGGAFTFEPRMHDNGEKLVLGQRITSGGKGDGEQVLDILAKHHSTAVFIAAKLSRRFVSDNPPAPLIDRAARRFRETDGDIRETVRTIVTSPEFFSAEAYRAKVKTPFEFVVSAVRATGTRVTTGGPFVPALRELGMPLYMCQPPTGYADRADAWVNTGALLARMNFAVSLTTGRFGAGGPGDRDAGIAPEVGPEVFVSRVLGGDLSEPTNAVVASAEQAPHALALLLGSPEFQKK
jgi:uncharacterized protein (DUF1800 family)